MTLGLPFLQAPWWLAVSLASYTLAGAIWGLLLPRLRPSFRPGRAQRHIAWPRYRPDRIHFNWRMGARRKSVSPALCDTESILIACHDAVLGLLIDLYGSVDRVLILVGLCFLLGLTLWR